jgi:hypothetical protein
LAFDKVNIWRVNLTRRSRGSAASRFSADIAADIARDRDRVPVSPRGPHSTRGDGPRPRFAPAKPRKSEENAFRTICAARARARQECNQSYVSPFIVGFRAANIYQSRERR